MIISNPACSHLCLSSELRTLLPLIAFSPIRKFSSAQPPCSEINSAASVSCSGLLIHVTSLVLGTVEQVCGLNNGESLVCSNVSFTLCRLLQQNHPEINGIVQNHITFSRCSVFQPVSASYSSWTAAVLPLKAR
ncbi:hypothetical protein BLNAU_14758 [Blattamonas nauphoetae]|uniref:Uncharacterized protein n=1 Tax=Blattamonas nauphoetae TaxID=2049346 RepID=A0ABQ9XE79_9EUKA|nr:hypothetical protein BLNAU_14758 [Blattamonas nauphoetae]